MMRRNGAELMTRWEVGGGCVGDGRNRVGGFWGGFRKKLTGVCGWLWGVKQEVWARNTEWFGGERFRGLRRDRRGVMAEWWSDLLNRHSGSSKLALWISFCKCRCEEFGERRTWLVVRTFRYASNLAKLLQMNMWRARPQKELEFRWAIFL
jgi:hypothetical protein